MASFSSVTGLECRTCGRSYALSAMLEGCPECRAAGRIAILDPVYALDALEGAAFPAAAGRLWDYHRLLPLPDPSSRVTLGEGGTPLIPLPQAADTGAAAVLFKYEAINPTHSFKDRANAVAVSMARHLGFRKIMCTSTGNHGVALAAYAARAGLQCLVLLPPGAPPAAATEIRFYGAEAVTVDGDIVSLMASLLRDHGWYVSQRNTPGVEGRAFGNPFGMEGYKTIAYEMFQQLGGRAPDRVFVPVGGGDGAWGIYKGFEELVHLGLAPSVPRITVCQSAAGAPLVNAYRHRLAQVATVDVADTVAFSIVDRHSGDHALWAIQRSHGQAVAVDDAAIREAEALLARTGVCVEPSSAASLAGLRELARSDEHFAGETVVLIGTGAGLRWPATFGPVVPPPRVDASLESLARVTPL